MELSTKILPTILYGPMKLSRKGTNNAAWAHAAAWGISAKVIAWAHRPSTKNKPTVLCGPMKLSMKILPTVLYGLMKLPIKKYQ
jgi:hypothetical protein